MSSKDRQVIRPTPEQRAQMAAYIERTQPGLLEELGMSPSPHGEEPETNAVIAQGETPLLGRLLINPAHTRATGCTPAHPCQQCLDEHPLLDL